MKKVNRLLIFILFFILIGDYLFAQQEYKVFGNRQIHRVRDSIRFDICFYPNLQNCDISTSSILHRQQLMLTSTSNQDVIFGLYEYIPDEEYSYTGRRAINLKFEIRNESNQPLKLHFYHSDLEKSLKFYTGHDDRRPIQITDDIIPKIIIRGMKHQSNNKACLKRATLPLGTPQIVIGNNTINVTETTSRHYCFVINQMGSLSKCKIRNYSYDIDIIGQNLVYCDKPFIFIDLNINNNTLPSEVSITIDKLESDRNYIFLYFHSKAIAKKNSLSFYQIKDFSYKHWSRIGQMNIDTYSSEEKITHFERVIEVIYETFGSTFTKKTITIYAPIPIDNTIRNTVQKNKNQYFRNNTFIIRNFDDLVNDFR